VVLAGPVFTKLAKKLVPGAFTKPGNIKSLGEQRDFNLEETPGFGISVFTALLPVLLMAIATIIILLQKTMGFTDNSLLAAIEFIGNADTAMLISLLVAIYTMGLARNIPIKSGMESCKAAKSNIRL
nr:gluconate permease [Bacillus pacificus]